MPEKRCAVAIMAKASVAGTVKTRLVPPLTYEEAAELNTCCLTDVAANIVATASQAPVEGFAAYYPLGSKPFFDDVLPVGFKLLPPREPTIGRSLFHAARDLFDAGYSSVCLVNADSPTLPTEFLVETVLRLRESGDRVVLGPAADGGIIDRVEAVSPAAVRGDRLEHRAGVPADARPSRRDRGHGRAAAEWYDVDDEAALAMLAREIGPCRSAASPYLNGYEAPSTAAFLEKLAAGNGGIERLFVRAGRPPFPPPPPRKG